MNITSLRYLTPFALAISLAACGPKTDQAAGDAGNAVGTAAADTGNAVGGAVDSVVNPTPSAQEFVDRAAKSDAFEIAAAKLAETNASSADVKAFAKKMIAAHTDSTLKIKKAAEGAAPAITPDATLSDDQKGKLDDLRKLKGADFDKAYASGQVDAHEDALSLMRTYADKGEAPTLKAAAGEIAPVVSGHLDMAKALAGK
jgi:putative membrane protein